MDHTCHLLFLRGRSSKTRVKKFARGIRKLKEHRVNDGIRRNETKRLPGRNEWTVWFINRIAIFTAMITFLSSVERESRAEPRNDTYLDHFRVLISISCRTERSNHLFASRRRKLRQRRDATRNTKSS